MPRLIRLCAGTLSRALPSNRIVPSEVGCTPETDRIVTQVRGGKSAELPQLTARELECLAWTAEGLTTSDIADKVCLSDSAVNYHLGKAARKLGGSSRHHAAILAIRSGLI